MHASCSDIYINIYIKKNAKKKHQCACLMCGRRIPTLRKVFHHIDGLHSQKKKKKKKKEAPFPSLLVQEKD
jgi:hypothetical protein